MANHPRAATGTPPASFRNGRDHAAGLTLLGDNRAEFRGLETFPAPEGLGRVTLRSDEVAALCPVTGQPDWYAVEVAYDPSARCAESKSVKLFLNSFRDRGVFCESLACLIRDAFLSACEPKACRVTVTQKPRGGVSITASSGDVP